MRARLLVAGGLAGVCALAWLYLWWMAREMYAASCPMHTVTSWTPAYFLMTFTMWAIMMVAMMLPSAYPMILTVARITQNRDHTVWRVWIFAAGYLLVWTVFSLGATLLQWVLHAARLLAPDTLAVAPLLGGILLLGAGFYQWSPLKQVCLARCNPLPFLLREWRDGAGGALRMGIRHGLFCTGCCAVLMLLLFVAGVMNLLWIAVIAAVVLLEKLLPPRRAIAGAFGVLLMLAGIGLAIEGLVHG